MPPVPPRRGAAFGRGARRLAPVALEVWRRWQALPPEEKERYRAMARRYADRGRGMGRTALDRTRRRRGPGDGTGTAGRDGGR